MFPGIFSTYFPRPFLTRPSAPITTGTVSIILLLVIILLLFHFTLITTSTIPQKSLRGAYLFQAHLRGEGGGSKETGGAYLRGGLN